VPPRLKIEVLTYLLGHDICAMQMMWSHCSYVEVLLYGIVEGFSGSMAVLDGIRVCDVLIVLTVSKDVVLLSQLLMLMCMSCLGFYQFNSIKARRVEPVYSGVRVQPVTTLVDFFRLATCAVVVSHG